MNHRTHPWETLLNLRNAERDQRRAAWLGAQQAELALQAECEHAAAAWNELQAATRRCVEPGPLDLALWGEHHRYGQVLRERLAELARQLDDCRQHVAQRHQALLAADREVRILENLRDRRVTRDQEARRKSETGQLQELALRKVGVAPAADFSDK